jgi:hypothetical protein
MVRPFVRGAATLIENWVNPAHDKQQASLVTYVGDCLRYVASAREHFIVFGDDEFDEPFPVHGELQTILDYQVLYDLRIIGIATQWFTSTDDHKPIGNCHRCYRVGYLGGICHCTRDTTTIQNLGFVTGEGISAAYNPYLLSTLLGLDDTLVTESRPDLDPWVTFTKLRECKGAYTRKFNRFVAETDDEDQRNGLRCYKSALVDPIFVWDRDTRLIGYEAFAIKKIINHPDMQDALQKALHVHEVNRLYEDVPRLDTVDVNELD